MSQLEDLTSVVNHVKLTVTENQGPLNGSKQSLKTLATIASSVQTRLERQAAMARAALGDRGSAQTVAQLTHAANKAKAAAQHAAQAEQEITEAMTGAIGAATKLDGAIRQLQVRA